MDARTTNARIDDLLSQAAKHTREGRPEVANQLRRAATRLGSINGVRAERGQR